MADLPYNRTIVNPRERPLSSDIDLAQSQLDYALRDTIMRLLADRLGDSDDTVSDFAPGFIAEGLKVVGASPSALSVVIKAGLGFNYDPVDVPAGINGIIGLDDLSPWKPIQLINDLTINIPVAPGPPNSRVDIVEVKDLRQIGNPLTRDVLNPITGVFAPNLVNKTLTWALDGQATVNGAGAINYKTGAPGNPGVAPATDAGYIKIAEVQIGSSVALVDDTKIVDFRTLIFPAGGAPIGAKWQATENAGGLVNISNEVTNAPPSVAVIITRESLAPSNPNGLGVRIYVIAGKPVGRAFMTATADGITGDTSSHVAITTRRGLYANPRTQGEPFQLAAGDLALINDASARPAGVKVALGQTARMYGIQSYIISPVNPFVSNAGVTGSGDVAFFTMSGLLNGR